MNWDRLVESGLGHSSWPLIVVDRFYRQQDVDLSSYLRGLVQVLTEAVQAGRITSLWAAKALAAAAFELLEGDKRGTLEQVHSVCDVAAMGKNERRDLREYLQEFGIRDDLIPAAQRVNETSSTDPLDATAAEIQQEAEALAQSDIGIITVLREEYDAVHSRLDAHLWIPSTRSRPNRNSWVSGNVMSSVGSFQVVLALTAGKGPSACQNAVRNLLEAFNPRYVLLVGVAGGLGDAQLGDVVVSRPIVGYEYGKVSAGQYRPKAEWVFATDSGVITAAETLPVRNPSWSDGIQVNPPTPCRSVIHVGPVGSGAKVIDDLTTENFRPVLEMWPNLLAIEMEGIGACEAIEDARERSHTVNFAMIRGISDRPLKDSTDDPTAPTQTVQRDTWKTYAAEAAACAAIELIRTAWPVAPQGES